MSSSRIALEQPREEFGLYGRLLFSVKCILRRRLEQSFHFLRNHEDGRSWMRRVRLVIAGVANILLAFKTHRLSPSLKQLTCGSYPMLAPETRCVLGFW